MKRLILIPLLLLFCGAQAESWKIEVKNRSVPRRNLVVSHVINHRLTELLQEMTVAELKADGSIVPVPCTIDTSGRSPVLVWLMSGETDLNESRVFELIPKTTVALPANGLHAQIGEKSIRIENSGYSLVHPLKGGGGFPTSITYAASNFQDDELFFLDRIVRPKDSGGLLQFRASECADATATLLFASPLRAVVEVRTGYGADQMQMLESPQAVYRYTYTAFSPVIEVVAEITQNQPLSWREVHFLHLTRKEHTPYTHVITGAPFKKQTFNRKGEKSRFIKGAQWAVLSDGTNACGAGFDTISFWDASDEFYYYIRANRTSWDTLNQRFNGALFFGSASDDNTYDAWMGTGHKPQIVFYRDGQPCYPRDWERAQGPHILKDRAIRIVFASAENGFDCIGIENTIKDLVRFVNPRKAAGGFWEMQFNRTNYSESASASILINNTTPCDEKTVRESGDTLEFCWKGISLPDEPGVVDVTANVKLTERGESEWRISVNNRSTQYGLWHTDFPRLTTLAEPGSATLAAPVGNWGGSLYQSHTGALRMPYPSARCPVQCMALFLGDAGIYMGAHDEKACTKELRISTSQDFSVRTFAADAGVSGGAGAPDYPVVVSALQGDWWEMARRYRRWALKQPWTAKGPINQRVDYPENLQNISFWMITRGAPTGITNVMQRAAKLYPDLKTGTHWYNWHEIPFDHSYPEYFPTKPGVADATRHMTGNNQVVMPYINGRLWDHDIESFATAAQAACQRPDGHPYIEIYGSKRKLVPMCPYTELWQSKIQEICARLVNEVGVNAIYLDQIGASRPRLCFNASHGHPLGGGHHWVDGYRRMLTPIKNTLAAKGVFLTTENTAEPYMDNIDAFLTWITRYENDIPLLPAIYSGYTIYFSSPQSSKDSTDAFCAAQARDFLWGCQLGWNSDWILQEQHRDKQQFQHLLCRYRAVAKDFFVYGQLLDELHLRGRTSDMRHIWNRREAHNATLPTVMGTLWRAPDDREALFIVNTIAQSTKISFDLSEQPQLKKRFRRKLRKLTPEGLVQRVHNKNIVEVELAPYSVLAYIID